MDTATETTDTKMNGTEGAAAPAETKRKRARLTETDIANLKVLKTQGKTLKEIADATGFSIGSIQKFTSDKPAGEKKARKPRAPKAAAPTKPASTRTDTVTAVRLAMADLLFAGHAVADIRGALASLNLAH